MNLFRWTAVTGILVAIAGCSDPIAPTSSTTIGQNLVRLTVSSSSSKGVRGGPMTFDVSLVNEGTAATILHFRDSCQIIPTIRNAVGEIVLPAGGAWACATVLTQLTLLPGLPVVREYVWTGSNVFQPQEPLQLLPAGKYSFTAEVPSGEATLSATVEIILM